MQVLNHSIQVHISTDAAQAFTQIASNVSKGNTTLVPFKTLFSETYAVMCESVKRDYRLIVFGFQSPQLEDRMNATDAVLNLVLKGAMLFTCYKVVLCSVSTLFALVTISPIAFSCSAVKTALWALAAIGAHDLCIMRANDKLLSSSVVYKSALAVAHEPGPIAKAAVKLTELAPAQYLIRPTVRWLDFGMWALIQNTMLQRALEFAPLRKELSPFAS